MERRTEDRTQLGTVPSLSADAYTSPLPTLSGFLPPSPLTNLYHDTKTVYQLDIPNFRELTRCSHLTSFT